MASKLMKAADLLAERGLDATKTEDIVAVTGIPKATLYYYFEGKEEVLSFIFVVVLDSVASAVAGAIGGVGTAAERLASVVRAHLAVFREYPKASQALQFDLGRAARRPEIAKRVNEAYVEPVAALLEEGATDGSLRKVDDTRLTAVTLLGATSTAALNVIALDADDDLKSLSEVIVRLMLDGLAS